MRFLCAREGARQSALGCEGATNAVRGRRTAAGSWSGRTAQTQRAHVVSNMRGLPLTGVEWAHVEVVVAAGEVGVEHVDCEPQGARVRAMGWACRLFTDSRRIRNSIAGLLHTLHRQRRWRERIAAMGSGGIGGAVDRVQCAYVADRRQLVGEVLATGLQTRDSGCDAAPMERRKSVSCGQFTSVA